MEKKHVNIKDVRATKTEITVIKCPVCGKEYESLSGRSYDGLIEDIKDEVETGFENFPLSKIKENLREGVFYPCYNCKSHIFPHPNKDLWHPKIVDALICPKCEIEVPKTQANYSGIGYRCCNCFSYLEYDNYPHHGTQKIKLMATTDYFHGICPNCTDDKSHGMMILGKQVWIEDSGKVVLALECSRCGYRDAVKIKCNTGRVKILDNPEGEPTVKVNLKRGRGHI